LRKFEALELETADFADEERRRAATIAMAQLELVTYEGEVVKNRNGAITRPLFAMRREPGRSMGSQGK
jgi:hypothetical protein